MTVLVQGTHLLTQTVVVQGTHVTHLTHFVQGTWQHSMDLTQTFLVLIFGHGSQQSFFLQRLKLRAGTHWVSQWWTFLVFVTISVTWL